MGDPAGPADGDHAGRGEHGLGARAPLFASATWRMTTTGTRASTTRPRFFAYLSFFTFAMLMLVTADNLVQMFFGWEGVGVASYLLIGFYYRKPTRQRRRDQGVRGQPGRRLRLCAWHLRAVLPDRLASASTTSSPPRPRWRRRNLTFLWARMERGEPDRRPAVHRGDGQVGAAVPAHLAAGRDGGPDAGVRADPRRDDGDGGRVPGLPDVAAVSNTRPTRRPSSSSLAPRRPSSRRPSVWCRTTSSA